MVKRLDSDVVGIRSARGEALGRAVSSATEAGSDCLTFELSGMPWCVRLSEGLGRTAAAPISAYAL